ncbi:MAG: choice-of-anchor L domain-containing protein [Bacteroidota bacterium]
MSVKKLSFSILMSGCLAAAHFFSAPVSAQISVTNNAPYNSVSYLVQNVLLGSGVTASNFTYNGVPVAIGFFNGVGTNLNLDSGIIMTSGDIALAPGPNNSSNAALQSGLPGDPDLDLIMSPTLSYDACILEFDFVPMADTVKFRYVFGSDEYMEYVSTFPGGINDGFGFFLSGPGINGPFTNNAVNIALIPQTTLPVTMFNLNLNNNGQYYFDNGDGNGTGTAPDGPDVQYDGFTVPLTASYPVQCGQTYHIKLAIGDGGDDWIDSGVFLEAGSFSASGINIQADISYGGPNDSTLFEGCGQACLHFIRTNTTLADTVQLNISGNATNGTDYTQVPSQVIFPVGVDTVTICITATSDGLPEGLDTVNIQAVTTGFCTQGVTYVTFYIGDYVPMSLSASADTSICPGDQVFLSAQASGGVQPYTYSWSTGSNLPSIVVSPTVTTTYSVTVTDSCNSVVTPQTITVNVIPSALSVSSPDITVCVGEEVQLNATVTGTASSYSWTTVSGPDVVNANTPSTTISSTTGTSTYLITVMNLCGTIDTEMVLVTVEMDCEISIPNVFTPNGDGENDFFEFENLDHYPNSRLVVYNRWGKVTYENSNYQNDWDGKNVVDGTYYFILYLSDGRTFPGFLTLLRNN